MQQSRCEHPEAWRSLAQPRAIRIRPLQPTDAALIHTMHQRLSPESLYYRYLQYRQPTLAEIATICHLAPATGAGFVAITQAADQVEEAIVGLAYYVREAHAPEPTAEPGILVEDRFQAQGIGRRLWQQLQQAAQGDDLRWLRVLCHPANARMARLVQGGGQPYMAKHDGGLHEYLVALDAAPRYAPEAGAQQSLGPRLVSHWRRVGNRLIWRWRVP